MLKQPKLRWSTFSIVILGAAFVVWSALFIYRSSCVAIDGLRYFSLFDDAMISMRYAWNLAHGLGPVWNIGERVEGYTNLLAVLLMAGPAVVLGRAQAVLAVQIMGVGCMLLVGWLMVLIADRVADDEGIAGKEALRVVAFAAGLGFYPLTYWTLMGMETGLVAALTLFGVVKAFDWRRDGSTADLLLLSGAAGLAYLARPDALLAFAVLFAFALLRSGNARRLNWGTLALALGPVCACIIGQFAFRLAYYGEWLPNTYVLKLSGMPLAVRIRNGFGYILPYLRQHLWVFVLLGLELVFRFKRAAAVAVALVFSSVAYTIYVGGDPWPYWRFLAPFEPLLLFALGAALWSILEAVSNSSVFAEYFLRQTWLSRRSVQALLVGILWIGGGLSVNAAFLEEAVFVTRMYQANDNQKRINEAVSIDALTTDEASVGVVWAGVIPYYTGRRAIDFLGKSDTHIARLPPDLSGAVGWDRMTSVPGHNKYDLEYSIKDLRPTVVQQFFWGRQDLEEWGRDHYLDVKYKGVTIHILRDSPDVRWDVVNAP